MENENKAYYRVKRIYEGLVVIKNNEKGDRQRRGEEYSTKQ
jgi:hypothetical protein